MADHESGQTAQPATRVDAVMHNLRERIASRSLMPGARVPSIRVMTDALGVSKSTVVEAYDRLVAEGAIVARRGSGFFVSGHAPPLALADLGPRLDREVDRHRKDQELVGQLRRRRNVKRGLVAFVRHLQLVR